MSTGVIVTIIVAVIAAAASITGAIVAYRAAGRAANSSRQIARESHGVAAIDRQSDELREAFDKFIEAFANARDIDKQIQVSARLDQLASCTGATAELQAACAALSAAVTYQPRTEPQLFPGMLFRGPMSKVSREYRNSQNALSAKRVAKLSG
ncbi:MAG: hypothetical protein ACTIBG_08845 [Brevibacterium aurantiacum]|uniref:hypothetical protein n=1 Tax=Brevibacterium aurantiacum TaxID=273384 RepID=UPI003F92BAE3